MSRSYVFFVHGVGLQEPKSWWLAWRDGLIRALQQYDEFREKSAAQIERDVICFKPVSYDATFEVYRKRWTDQAAKLATNQVTVQRQLDHVFAWVADQDETLKRVFWTHALDAILWYVFPEARAAVQVSVAQSLVAGLREMIAEQGAGAHLIAHSLGTSVAHDALVGMAGQKMHDGGGLAQVRWKSVSMIANTGRLLRAWKDNDAQLDLAAYDPFRSVVRPGEMTDVYFTFRHQIDPITWPRTFEPPVALTGASRSLTTRHFADPKRVHDLEHYLENPVVHLPILRQIVGRDDLGVAQTEAVLKRFKETHPHTKDAAHGELRALLQGDAELPPKQLGEYLTRAFAVLR